METIVFKYECPDCGNDGGIDTSITMKFNSEGMVVYDFIDCVRQFMLAMGYQPESINKAFEAAIE